MRGRILLTGSIVMAALFGHVEKASAYGMAGCGLGSMIIKDNGIVQIFAATTNGTFGSQTFGITSGTSNCTKGGVVAQSREQEAFFEANYARLQQDMAKGGGEYLAAFGELMGCKETVQPSMFAYAQESYGHVFPTETTTPEQALYAFKLGMAQDARFREQCAQL